MTYRTSLLYASGVSYTPLVRGEDGQHRAPEVAAGSAKEAARAMYDQREERMGAVRMVVVTWDEDGRFGHATFTPEQLAEG